MGHQEQVGDQEQVGYPKQPEREPTPPNGKLTRLALNELKGENKEVEDLKKTIIEAFGDGKKGLIGFMETFNSLDNNQKKNILIFFSKGKDKYTNLKSFARGISFYADSLSKVKSIEDFLNHTEERIKQKKLPRECINFDEDVIGSSYPGALDVIGSGNIHMFNNLDKETINRVNRYIKIIRKKLAELEKENAKLEKENAKLEKENAKLEKENAEQKELLKLLNGFVEAAKK